MLFPTATFALFFLVVLPLSWLTMPWPHRWRPFIIIASYAFYSWWDWRFVLLLAGCTLWNQLLAVRIWRSTVKSQRRALLILALAGDLGVLGYFKYYDFFVSSTDNLATYVGMDLPFSLKTIVLPVGISFFTFMAISYVVDAYRGEFQPTTLEKFAVYLSFFPHLVAGPIVRPAELIPQIETPPGPAPRRHEPRLLPDRNGPLQEGRDRELPRLFDRRPGVRDSRPALVPRDPYRDLRLRRPDLRRLLRLHRHRDRDRAASRLHVPAELRLAVRGGLGAGLLATLAHDALALAP